MSEIITVKSEEIVCLFKAIDEMQNDYEELKKIVRAPFNGELYLSDKEVSERLKICRRTLQEWRNKGVISYIKFEGKIIYRESDLQRLIENHYIKAFSDMT